MRERVSSAAGRNRVFLALLICAQVASALFAWRDLNRRADRQVRGNPRLWRTAITIHPGNSLAYWLLGRR